MNNLYHKIAVASVGIALGFALGANKEARAATFTFTSTRSYYVVDYNLDGVIDNGSDYPGPRYVGKRYEDVYPYHLIGEYRSFYQFNIANLPLDSNTRIKSASFQTRVESIEYIDPHNDNVSAYGFTEYSPLIDNGEYLAYDGLYRPNRMLTFNIVQFVVNQRINNNNSFGLSIRPSGESSFALSYPASLTIVTERVPEPTTIFGSAIGLCLGGWLKRRKLALQNKTTSQK